MLFCWMASRFPFGSPRFWRTIVTGPSVAHAAVAHVEEILERLHFRTRE